MARHYIKTCTTCHNVYSRSTPSLTSSPPEQIAGICAWCRAKELADARNRKRTEIRRARVATATVRANTDALALVHRSLLDAQASTLHLPPGPVATMLADHLDWLIKAIARMLDRAATSSRH